MIDDETETAPVRAADALDWPRLEGWLREHIGDLPGAPMRVLQFPRGTANLTYQLGFGDRLLVLRRPPFGKTAPGAHDMGREHAILSRLWRAYPRAPRAFALCEDAEVIGAPFVVQEYRDGGVVIFGEAPAAFAGLPDLGARLTRALADALADLHLVDYAAEGLQDLGKPDGFVARQLKGWRDRWDRVRAPACADLLDRICDRLTAELPAPIRASIVHNDFKLDNCQFRPGDPDRAVSVFDWDMATLGDPLIDVGITLAYWPHMQKGESLGLPDKAVFARIYADRMGIGAAALRWYEGFAYWRNAIAVQQLAYRYQQGDSANPKLAGAAASVITLAERAEAVLQEVA